MSRARYRVAVALVSAGAAVVVTVPAASAGPAASAVPAAAVAPNRYTTVSPQRVLDTRATVGPLGPGATRVLDLSGTTVPATAVAVVLNLTATGPTAAGYLTVHPADTPRPLASSLNKQAGETRSNSVTVALPSDGSRLLDVYNQAGSTDVVVDLLGWYGPDGASSYYGAVTPERIFDSRPVAQGGYLFAPGHVDDFAFDFGPGVTAVALNLTVGRSDGPGYLTAWDGSGPAPTVSSVNYETGRVTPNFAIVPTRTAPNGDVHFAVQNNVSDADIVIDLVGLYAATGGSGSSAYVPVAPRRIDDTRSTGALGPNAVHDTTVPGGRTALGANVNVTAVGPTVASFLTVYADDVARPGVSNLNVGPGDVVPNAVQTALGADGRYRVYNSQGSVDVVADLEGLFVSDVPDDDAPRRGITVPVVTATSRPSS